MGKRYAWKHIRTPWDGQPGFWPAINRFFYLFEGPAQLGEAGEAPRAASTHAACPICSAPMRDHVIDRDGPDGRTLLHCPPRDQATERAPERALPHQEPGA